LLYVPNDARNAQFTGKVSWQIGDFVCGSAAISSSGPDMTSGTNRPSVPDVLYHAAQQLRYCPNVIGYASLHGRRDS
jgi:hypothetical protein